MRLVRNLAFVVLLVVGVMAAHKTQAFSGFCPEGCWCHVGLQGQSVVDCYLVEDCADLYTSFCADAYDWCYNNPGCLPDMYGCSADFWNCYAECRCAPVEV